MRIRVFGQLAVMAASFAALFEGTAAVNLTTNTVNELHEGPADQFLAQTGASAQQLTGAKATVVRMSCNALDAVHSTLSGNDQIKAVIDANSKIKEAMETLKSEPGKIRSEALDDKPLPVQGTLTGDNAREVKSSLDRLDDVHSKLSANDQIKAVIEANSSIK